MSNCLTFAKFPFEKLVRNVVSTHNTTPMKISKDVFIVLQYFIEQQITSLLRNANFAAIHAGRVKLMPIDIDFVNAISSGGLNPYQQKSLDTNDTTLEVVEQENTVDDEIEEEIVEEEIVEEEDL
jgi:histone H3/H4